MTAWLRGRDLNLRNRATEIIAEAALPTDPAYWPAISIKEGRTDANSRPEIAYQARLPAWDQRWGKLKRLDGG
jgi:hypothetical protein